MNKEFIVITGTSGGLGEALALKILSQNIYGVLGISRKSNNNPLLLNSSHYAEINFDLSRVSEIRGLVNIIRKDYGIPFGLINNAAAGNDGILATMHETDIEKLLAVNLHAPILLAKYLGRLMLAKRKGRIINISSVVANTGYSGLAVYAATKSGLLGLTGSLAREYGKVGIEVNCVSPGFMMTSMTEGLGKDQLDKIRRRSPSKSLPHVSNIANFCNLLLDPMGSGMNGSNTIIDCGNSA